MITSLVVIESFLNPNCAIKVWPKSVTASRVFWEQLKQRGELLDRLNNVVNCLPRQDMSFETAVKQRYIDGEQVAKLYTSLSDLLEFTPEYKRLILYLPFEFLPTKTWHPSEEILQQASDRFKQTYMKAWKNLLSTKDARANFVDGDVLEIEHRVGDLPRVVKAAHLIPKLVEKGWMEIKDILGLMEESSDETLRDSIADTLPVLSDLGLISEKEIKLMEASKDWLARNMARIIREDMKSKSKETRTIPAITFSFIREKLSQEFFRIETTKYGNITEKRKKWLKQSKKQKAIEALAEITSATVVKNILSHLRI